MKIFYILFIAVFSLNAINAQWIEQKSGTTDLLRSVYFPNADTGYAVGHNGTILKTTNGGSTWIAQIEGNTNTFYSLYFTDPNTGYVVGDSGKILKTINGGTTWTVQRSGITEALRSVYFTAPNIGYVVGGEKILKTSNGGTTWTAQTSGTSDALHSLYFTDSNIGYVVGFETILKTINGGTTWTILKSGIDWMPQKINGKYLYLASVCFTDSINGYIVGHGYAYFINAEFILTDKFILKTCDGGATWTEQNNITDYQNSIFFIDSNTGYAVGANGSIIKTVNGGTTWSSQTSGTTNSLTSVYFTDSINGYVVGVNGLILKTTNGGILWIEKNREEEIFNIYPNPANTLLTIEIPLSAKKGILTIINMNGQKLLKQQIKDNKIQVDISNLAKGIYFVKLKTDKIDKVKKIVKE